MSRASKSKSDGVRARFAAYLVPSVGGGIIPTKRMSKVTCPFQSLFLGLIRRVSSRHLSSHAHPTLGSESSFCSVIDIATETPTVPRIVKRRPRSLYENRTMSYGYVRLFTYPIRQFH